MNISLGMITKDFLLKEPLEQFLGNAKKFNHEIFSVIIAYADKVDENLVLELRKEVEVKLIKIKSFEILYKQLKKINLKEDTINHLIGNVGIESDIRGSYGLCRNHVVLEAMLTGTDILVFIDTDVYPEVIIKNENKIQDNIYSYRESGLDNIIIQEVDFIGRHLEFLKNKNIAITTSDYSGYYIIPPMKFDGMKEFFYGIKKELSYNYIKNNLNHNCLFTDKGKNKKPFITTKILGGNMAMKLDLFYKIVPFFSTTYEVKGIKYLTRGEDTVLGIQIGGDKKKLFYDIDTKIFHNTYSNFPVIPNIENNIDIQNRFFNACMGWIGRNPFLNYLNGENIEERFISEHNNLIYGSKKIAEYLKDARFLILPEAHKEAYNNLDRMIEEFDDFKNSWFEFIEEFKKIKKLKGVY